MTRRLCASVSLALVAVAIPLRAANKAHAGTDSQNTVVWTNDDLEKLNVLGLISIVGRIDEKANVGICAWTVRENPEPGVVCRAGGEAAR